MPASPAPEMNLPRVQRAPTLEDFSGMKPSPEIASQLMKVSQFVQRRPSDGAPISQRTEAYCGYDEKYLYFVFLAFDSERAKLRARMVSRENFVSERGDGIDDMVSVSLDTFNDKRRMYVFQVNPYGIQWDGVYDESGRFDKSWDGVWRTRGAVTGEGFIVWIAIPFKTLRFSHQSKQTWGIILNRDIPRNNEASFWPAYSSKVSGYANQAAPMNGLQNISPARNFQFIPYGAFRAFRAIDNSSISGPVFKGRRAEFDGGLDGKFVLKDSLVLDVTVNPDFSQVESDNPQITASERFEVFFPEKRPFFLENATFFATPNNLVFTRRIAEPQFGARLTGKIGKYSIGALLADDEAPGKDPTLTTAAGKRAFAAIARVSRDVFSQSNVGAIFVTREFAGSFSRVGGVDARFRIGRNWTSTMQAVASSTRFLDGSTEAGPAYDFGVRREGRQFRYNFSFFDRSPGFRAGLGFLPRRNIRNFNQTVSYRWRPEGKRLISWGPQVISTATYDHQGLLLGWEHVFFLQAEFAGQTNISFLTNPQYEAFTPADISWLTRNMGFHRYNNAVMFSSQVFRQALFSGEFVWGERVNKDPVVGQDPYVVNRRSGNMVMTLNPSKRLQIDNTYLFFRLSEKTGGGIFNNHILRSKWNLQLTRELSVRVILQYDALLANQTRTSLETSKNFNADFLITYLLHPGTALYVGYNSNLQNVDIIPCVSGQTCSTQLVRTSRFINDARGLFAKFSYLFRF